MSTKLNFKNLCTLYCIFYVLIQFTCVAIHQLITIYPYNSEQLSILKLFKINKHQLSILWHKVPIYLIRIPLTS